MGSDVTATAVRARRRPAHKAARCWVCIPVGGVGSIALEVDQCTLRRRMIEGESRCLSRGDACMRVSVAKSRRVDGEGDVRVLGGKEKGAS